MFRFKASPALACLFTLGAAQANAQALAEDETFRLSALADLRFVENANLRPSSEININEWQWRGGLAARGQLSNDWARWITDYEIEDRRFSGQEGFDDQVLLGRSTLQLGRDSQPVYAILSHASRELLVDPAEGAARRNIDQRVISDATIYGNLEPGQGNRVSSWVNVADIRYRNAEVNDARRYGGGVGYNRLVSMPSTVGVSFSGYNMDFYNADLEVVYLRAALTWQTNLRHLSYLLEGGYNQSRSDQQTFSAPFVNLMFNYERAGQMWGASARQWLSDTSQGRGEFQVDTPALDQPAGRLGVVDQLRRREFQINWRNEMLCIGCRVDLELGVEEEAFRQFEELDNREWFSRANFTYVANRHVTLDTRLLYRYYEFTDLAERGDYQDYRLEFRAQFNSLMRRGELEWLVGGVIREFDDRNGYSSGYTGLTLRYELYRR